jgi:hypothetical protein
MPFLAGPITFECFRLNDSDVRQFGPKHIKLLEEYAISRVQTSATEQPDVGFLAGSHLFDCDFSLEKNVIGEALHCAVRIDTNQIPAAIRKAWLQIELAGLTVDNPGDRPTKAQRAEAKEAVAARCEEEAQSGKFRRMQQFPVLWDAREGLLYVGASSATACDACADLFCRAFDLEMERLTSGRRAQEWAAQAKRQKALEESLPSDFHPSEGPAVVAWWNGEVGNADFLGNEFLLWLWWHWETQSDTIALSDESEVTGMLTKTLSLQCPRGESGKETITAESPIHLPESRLAVRSGKLPRKTGLILVRHGEQYELVLQPETFTVSGAKIQTEEKEDASEGRGAHEDRIESVRGLHETLDLLFRAFCERRLGKTWGSELEHIRGWLKKDPGRQKKPAA